MSELKGNLTEYTSICAEIERLTKVIRGLKKRKTELEGKVVENLDKDNHKGVKYKGEIYRTKKKEGRKRKTKMEKQDDISDVLRKYGIHNTSIAVAEIEEAMKGHKVMKSTLAKPRKKKNA